MQKHNKKKYNEVIDLSESLVRKGKIHKWPLGRSRRSLSATLTKVYVENKGSRPVNQREGSIYPKNRRSKALRQGRYVNEVKDF